MIICLAVSALPAEASRRTKDPRTRLDEVYLLLTKANTDLTRGKDVPALKGFVLSSDEMLKIRKEHPDFEAKEVDDILRIIQAQLNVLKEKVQKDGVIEYRGKKLPYDQFVKMVLKEKEREERWERFQKWQEEERRRREQQRVQDDIRKINEINRFNAEQRRQAQDRQMREELRRQAEARRDAEARREADERRRRYEEQQMRQNKP